MKSTVYLLCGLPGSGKTTYAKELEKEGAIRLTLDEEVFKRFGREYDNHDEKQKHTKEALTESMKEYISEGKSVVLDFGFWTKADRDDYKALIEKIGGQWQLLYFKANLEVLKQRLFERNSSNPTENHIIDKNLLQKFIDQFEEPVDEGELVV